MKNLLLSFLFFCFVIPLAHSAPIQKEWTMLLFLNGNNNLNIFGRLNLLDMEKVGSTDQINIVTQWADIQYRKTQRLYVTKSSDPTRITSPVIEDLGPNVDMGDWRTLSEFIKWGVANYPAKRFFIVVWDHGTGWHGLEQKQVTDISYDEISGHSISTPELGFAMEEAQRAIGHKVDLYGSDACQMGMIEVATEMADSVDLYLGSEQNIPADGWPYSRFLEKWVLAPFISPRELAGLVHSEYLGFYRQFNSRRKHATFSLFDLNATGPMLQAIKFFGQELSKVSGANLALAREASIQAMAITIDYSDLLDFADHLKAAKLKGFNLEVISNLQRMASSYVLLNGATSLWEKKAKGISIWLPSAFREYNLHLEKYKGLKFSPHTNWGENIFVLQK